VTVVAACDRPCSLAATGVAIAGRRSFALGRTSARLDAAGSRVLALRIPRAMLGHHGRARVHITVRAASADGEGVAATRVVVVRR
jgi:hypothetical protein